MALVDPNIAMSYRGIELPNQLAQYGQVQAIQNAQRQNKLVDLQMQEYERTRAEEEGVRNFLSGADLTSPETRAGLMKFGKTGLGYNKALADAETAGLTRQKTQLEVDAKKFENQNKQLDFVWNGVGASATPQDAINYITQGVKNGNLSMVQGSAEVKRLQNIQPGDFRKYKIEKVLGVLDAKEKLAQFAQTTKDTDLGGVIERQIYDAQGMPIGAPQQLRKTPTIGDMTAQGNLSLQQRKFAFEQANPGITVQQTEDGTLVGVNNRTGQAMPITMGGAAPMAPATAPASNAFSPRLLPTATPAVTQAIPGMPSVLDQRAPAAPVVATPATPMAGTPLRGKGAASTTTEGERKASTLLQRLQFSESQLTKALVDDPNAAKPGLFTSALDMLSTPLANTLTSEARQRVESAQLDILDAALTLGTGAAYTKEQLEGYRRSYFPQIGDGPTQIEDKKARLQNVISAAKIAAGKGAALVPSVPDVSDSKNTVTDPTGMVHTFPTAEAAAAFKKAAGIK